MTELELEVCPNCGRDDVIPPGAWDNLGEPITCPGCGSVYTWAVEYNNYDPFFVLEEEPQP